MSPQEGLNTSTSGFADAVALFQGKREAPQAKISIRFNQTETAEAVSMLRKVGFDLCGVDGTSAVVLDPSTLFLALLHKASKALPEAPEGDARVEEFVKAVLFPAPVREDGESAPKGARKPARKRRK